MKTKKKHILCFGDSNTYGFNPHGGRYDDDTRWTRVLAGLLGSGYLILEEGLNSRTTALDDPYEPYRNAMDHIVPCIQTHAPLDLTILMLGTNDLKDYFQPSVEKICRRLRRLTEIILEVSQAPILLVCPAALGESSPGDPCALLYPPHSVEVSRNLGTALKKTARELGVPYMDASDYVSPDPADHVHLSAESHALLARAFAEKIIELGI